MEKIIFNSEERCLPYGENLRRGFIGGSGALLFFFLMLPFALGALLPHCVSLPEFPVAVSLFSQLGLGAATLAFLYGGKPLAEVLELGDWKTAYLKIGIPAGILMILLTAGVQASYFEIARIFGYDMSGPNQVEQMILNMNVPGIALLAVTAVLVAPIVEEIFFRRVFFGFMAPRISWIPALIVTAVSFGLIHADLKNLPGLIMLGVGFQLMYIWQKSLYPAIVMHMTNNIFAMTALVFTKYYMGGNV